MKKSALILALALGVSALTASAQDQSTPPASGQRPAAGEAGPGQPGKHPGFHLLPPRAMEQLNLTEDQQKQVAALEAETKAKLEKILTPEQMQQLKQMRPPRPPGRGFGGGPDRGPGGPGGEGHRPPPDQEQ